MRVCIPCKTGSASASLSHRTPRTRAEPVMDLVVKLSREQDQTQSLRRHTALVDNNHGVDGSRLARESAKRPAGIRLSRYSSAVIKRYRRQAVYLVHSLPEDAQSRVTPFPAPLCAPCNEPMGLNGESAAPIRGKMSNTREYQCGTCGAAMFVRRSNKDGTN